MEQLTEEQIQMLRDYLEGHGLSHETLQTEMLDHLCCDIEMLMTEGSSFDETWEKVKSEIPENQFSRIQKETMEATEKNTKIVGVITHLSFACLLIATIFKLLHLPGTSVLLMVSFAGLAATLLTGYFSSPLIKQRNSGRTILLAIILSVLVYICSLCFQWLHFPGTYWLRIISVSSSILLLSGYAIYAYLNPKKISQHIIMKYLDKEAFSVEKTLITLFIFGISLNFWKNNFITVVFFMLAFAFGSVFYFVQSWRYFTDLSSSKTSKLFVLFSSILIYMASMVPSIIGLIDIPTRILLFWGSYSLAALVISWYYLNHSHEAQNTLIGCFSIFITLSFVMNIVAKTLLFQTEFSAKILEIVYSPITFISLTILLLVYFKKTVFRALLLMTLAAYACTYHLPGI